MQRRYFGTDGIRGHVGTPPITVEFILKLGWAIGRVLSPTGGGRVLIGKDTRVSGYLFESALQAGLSSAGLDILLTGPMPTPAIAYLTRTLHAKAGIVISASHNPYHDNGIKFFSALGKKLPDDVESIIEQAMEQPLEMVDSARLGKARRIDDAAGRYIEFCKSTVPYSTELNGLKIVVDCAHGATYHVAPDVFRELGAEVVRIGVEPDGFNINADCGSTYPEALSRAVLAQRADLGVAFDGDGDRVVMVDHQGEVADGDELLYIIARARRHIEGFNGIVVGTQMSNLGLEHALAALNIELKRAAVGDRYVMEMLEQHGATLGGESSGHIICLDRTTTGDGIVAALQVLAEMVRRSTGLHELRAGMSKYPQYMVNVPVARRIDLAMPAIQTKLRSVEAEMNGSGRVLLRASGTEPVIRVMVEGEDAARVAAIANELADTVRAVAARAA